MTPTSERAQELRQLADALDAIDSAGAKYVEAKQRYEENSTDKNKAAFRAASEALVEARRATRGSDTVRAVAPGDVSITPGTAGKG